MKELAMDSPWESLPAQLSRTRQTFFKLNSEPRDRSGGRATAAVASPNIAQTKTISRTVQPPGKKTAKQGNETQPPFSAPIGRPTKLRLAIDDPIPLSA